MSASKHSLIAALQQACSDISGEIELSHLIADGEKHLAENPPPPEIVMPKTGDFDPVAYLEAMRKEAPVDWYEAQAAVSMSFSKGKALGASWALKKILEAMESWEAEPPI